MLSHIQGLNYRLGVEPNIFESTCVPLRHLLRDQGFPSAHSCLVRTVGSSRWPVRISH